MIVAICDDNEVFRSMLKNYLLKYKKERNIQLDIIEFDNGSSLLNSKEIYDIVFLDYQMPELNGMETARILRARKSICCIIFITSYPEFVVEAFEVNTYRFLIKPIDETKLSKYLDEYIKDKKMFSPINVIVNGERRTINSEDIIYLEGLGKYCNIRTSNETIKSSKTLSKAFELLPQHCFCRIHKSYAVNLHYISSVKNNIITLSNGEKASISRNHINDFKSTYKNFLKHFISNYD